MALDRLRVCLNVILFVRTMFIVLLFGCIISFNWSFKWNTNSKLVNVKMWWLRFICHVIRVRHYSKLVQDERAESRTNLRDVGASVRLRPKYISVAGCWRQSIIVNIVVVFSAVLPRQMTTLSPEWWQSLQEHVDVVAVGWYFNLCNQLGTVHRITHHSHQALLAANWTLNHSRINRPTICRLLRYSRHLLTKHTVMHITFRFVSYHLRDAMLLKFYRTWLRYVRVFAIAMSSRGVHPP